ncbi:MAG: acyl-CoA thioesterase [Pirellula sp.]
MISEHETTIRVHYHEVDGQGRVHNSNYLSYFERGRVQMLRASGISYKELESTVLMLDDRMMHVDNHAPAVFDDLLVLKTRLGYCHGARIEHHYRLVRPRALPSDGTTRVESPAMGEDAKLGDSGEGDLIVSGRSEIGCIDASGRVRRLPAFLQLNLRGDRDGD